jgi:hypothetical protein
MARLSFQASLIQHFHLGKHKSFPHITKLEAKKRAMTGGARREQLRTII